MFNSQSYGKWQRMLKQLIPDSCPSRLANLVWLLVGIFESRSVYLSVIARKLPIRAKKLSIAKRLERFLSNQAVEVENWYRPWAEWLIQSASSAGQLHLVIDSTKVSAHCRLVMIAVAYRRRTLPLMWAWVDYSRGHCTTQLQLELFRRLNELIPPGVRVSVVGDGEFNHPLLIEEFCHWSWDYAVRVRKDTLILPKGSRKWIKVCDVDVPRGQHQRLETVLLTQASPFPTHLVIYCAKGQTEPWYLATNQVSSQATLRLYKRRMWIEEMFGDMKGHGFDLEMSRLRSSERLSRLTLVVCILYVWLITLGEFVLKHALYSEVDRKDRHDLSIFRLGWDWIERRLVFDDPIPLLFCPNFCSVSGC